MSLLHFVTLKGISNKLFFNCSREKNDYTTLQKTIILDGNLVDSGRSCPLTSHYSDPCKPIIEFKETTLRKSPHYFYEDVILNIKLSENDCQRKEAKMLKSKKVAASNVKD